MKAVILAAGTGSRINKESNEVIPKPLYKINDKRLIEHVILNLKKAGIKDFVIIVGFMADDVRNALGDGTKYGVKIEYVFNPEFKKPLGLSVLSAREAVKDEKEFIISMSDHVIEPEGVKKIVDYELEEGSCALLIDKKIKDIFWLDDAAKVKLEGNIIRGVNKKFEEYDAIDCGVFKCTPVIFDEIENHIEHPDSISAAVSVFSNKDKMFGVDIGEYKWVDIDEYSELEEARKIFKDILQ